MMFLSCWYSLVLRRIEWHTRWKQDMCEYLLSSCQTIMPILSIWVRGGMCLVFALCPFHNRLITIHQVQIAAAFGSTYGISATWKYVIVQKGVKYFAQILALYLKPIHKMLYHEGLATQQIGQLFLLCCCDYYAACATLFFINLA